jgi:hypothetical protein
MKNPFTSRNNASLCKKVVIWFAISLSIVSSLIVTLPLLANGSISNSQFCQDNGGAHVSTCMDLLKLIGPDHASPDMLTLLGDKTFMQKLQAYEQKSSATATPTATAKPQNTGPSFDTYLFRHGYEVDPTLTPTGGSGNCGQMNRPVTLNKSKDNVAFFGSSVNLTVYSFDLKQNCSYQASWNLASTLQIKGCSYATAYFKDKMSIPITYQLLPSSDSFLLSQGQLLYTSTLESTITQIIAKFDSTQTKTVAVAPFYLVCDNLRDPIVPQNGSTLMLGNATLTFTVLNRQSDPDGWCTPTMIANTYNCVLDWPNKVSILKHETSPDFAGQFPFCQPSWLSDLAKRAKKDYSYSCGFIDNTSGTTDPSASPTSVPS